MNSSNQRSSGMLAFSAARWIAVSAALCLASTAVRAQSTPLADAPPLATYSVPGNLGLVLSVEYPTAVSVAYTGRSYVAATQYQGYFDSEKCYTYTYSSSDTPAAPNTATPATYFSPAGSAANHLCNVGSATGQWSGNFMNWAAMQTIDTFRSVLTGGYRVIDTASPALTVLEKAWATGDGGAGNFPDSTLAAADVAGATPFGGANTSTMAIRIQGLGNVMRFSVGQATAYQVTYYNNKTLTAPAAAGPLTVNGTGAIKDNTSPAPNVSNAVFSAHYETTVTAPATGNYTFQTRSDDGVRLSVNGTQIINNWTDHGPTTDTSSSVALTAGQTVAVVLEYYQAGGGATLSLTWLPPGSSSYVDLSGGASVNASSQPWTGGTASPAVAYDVFVRAKVCDTVGNYDSVESLLCTVYGSNAKPEGLLQKYNKKLRYSALGYLNDNTNTRDGGVLRAPQKYVGPMTYAFGLADATNPAAEWDASTGVFVRNPNTSDASASNVSDSGVLNYINKFGELCLPLGSSSCRHSYKTFDPVSELYYAAIRYFKAVGNVPEWSNLPTDPTSQARMRDGFPVITNWADPIENWCQKNFILGIGDVNTHADKNVTGATPTNNEPAKPQKVIDDTNSTRSPTDAVTATNRVGLMEANYAASYYLAHSTASNLQWTLPTTGSLGTATPWPAGQDNSSALMAGLAYDSHTTDIRNDLTKPAGSKVTIDTYWVDVQEIQQYKPNNQYYLATKYGGFTVPSGFDPYTATTLPSDGSWWNQTDYSSPFNGQTPQPRPNNYFSGGNPQAMRAGLTTAFSSIVSASGTINSTSFLTALPQVGSSGAASYSAKFDSSAWTGDVIGSNLVINTDGTNTTATGGDFQANLDSQGTSRRIATWSIANQRGVQFLATAGSGTGASAIDSSQLSTLDTTFVSGNDSAAYLAYLRGDRSQEAALGTTPTTSKPYRARTHLLGDIVDSKPVAVGPPSFPFADASNPGYNAYKTGAAASRPTVVYVGANDGMLHAIDGRLATSATASSGSELFAYVPNAVFLGPNGTPSVDGLASLGNPNFVHHYLVNATASNFDVDFNRTSTGSAAPPVSWTPDWHSILIGGLGKGGKAFYALDITDPTSMSQSEVTLASKVLWEFTNVNMGYSYGEPAVTKTKKYGWVVILPSGYNTADGRGHLFFLNPTTGALLETVDMPAGSGGLAHVDGFVVDATDDTVDALYAGDLQGNLWRVDVTAAFVNASTKYPAPLLLARLTDGASPTPAAQPITTRPTIAVDPSTGNQNSGARYVMVGTGRLLDSTDIGTTASPGQTQSFYALIDGTNATFNAAAVTGVTFPITRSQLAVATATTTTNSTASALVAANPAGWYIDLSNVQAGPASRVLHDATVDFGRVALPVTQPAGSACAPGGVGAVYAFNFGTAQSVLVNNSTSTLMAFQPVGYDVTEARFVSANGTATLLYGGNGNATQQPIAPNSSASTRRINWREVPTAD